MSVIELPKNVCQICKKREATRLCDKVKGEWRYIGHPPKINGIISQKSMSGIIMCDRLLCDQCTTNITGMDFCPKCLAETKSAIGVK